MSPFLSYTTPEPRPEPSFVVTFTTTTDGSDFAAAACAVVASSVLSILMVLPAVDCEVVAEDDVLAPPRLPVPNSASVTSSAPTTPPHSPTSAFLSVWPPWRLPPSGPLPASVVPAPLAPGCPWVPCAPCAPGCAGLTLTVGCTAVWSTPGMGGRPLSFSLMMTPFSVGRHAPVCPLRTPTLYPSHAGADALLALDTSAEQRFWLAENPGNKKPSRWGLGLQIYDVPRF